MGFGIVLIRLCADDCALLFQIFFKPKKVIIQTDRRWGVAEKEKLLEVGRSARMHACVK